MSSVQVYSDKIDDVQEIIVEWRKGETYLIALCVPDREPGFVRHERTRRATTKDAAIRSAKRWARDLRRTQGSPPNR